MSFCSPMLLPNFRNFFRNLLQTKSAGQYYPHYPADEYDYQITELQARICRLENKLARYHYGYSRHDAMLAEIEDIQECLDRLSYDNDE